MAALSVLLVDDDDDIRRIGEISLVDVGGDRVVLASSGEEAIGLADGSIDVVLLDAMMPGLSGEETLARLLAKPGLAGVRVIFLTANVQARDVDRYRQLGALGVIAKPFDPVTLPTQIRAILAGAER